MIGRPTKFLLSLAAALPVAAQAPPDPAPEPPAAEPAAQEPAVQGEPEETVRLDLRVSTAGPGPRVTVDRGASDGLRAGDEVVFRPREGGVWRGVVARADERTAAVDLLDPAFVPQPGTRGEVRIPAARLARPAAPAPPPSGEGGEPHEPTSEGLPPHPGWQEPDDEWTPGLPLLARVRAVRPEDRAKQHGGRLTLLADTTWTTEDGRSDAILRLGSDLWLENPFGKGGSLEMDLAFDQYDFETPDDDADDETAFRVDRLSYVLGGTRFAPRRVEAGRFLQHGMPELGVLDGVEVEQRLSSHHRVGASLGYMPEPDVEFDSFDDLQIAAFYEWTLDRRADVTLAAGVQKTWHDGSPDRDLIVTRFDYLPGAGWDLRGTAWVDLYDSGDDESGLALTHGLLSTSRRWERDGIDVSYRHLEFPDLLRQEYVESIFEDLADSAYDRLAASWVHETRGGTRLRALGGVWRDEEERGGDVELGVDVTDAWVAGDDAGVAVFGTRGSYSADAGMRFSWGLSDEKGRWDVSYRFADRHMDEFSHESDDLWEHAVRGARAFHLGDGWYASLASEARTFDEELDLSLTMYVQKSF